MGFLTSSRAICYAINCYLCGDSFRNPLTARARQLCDCLHAGLLIDPVEVIIRKIMAQRLNVRLIHRSRCIFVGRGIGGHTPFGAGRGLSHLSSDFCIFGIGMAIFTCGAASTDTGHGCHRGLAVFAEVEGHIVVVHVPIIVIQLTAFNSYRVGRRAMVTVTGCCLCAILGAGCIVVVDVVLKAVLQGSARNFQFDLLVICVSLAVDHRLERACSVGVLCIYTTLCRCVTVRICTNRFSILVLAVLTGQSQRHGSVAVFVCCAFFPAYSRIVMILFCICHLINFFRNGVAFYNLSRICIRFICRTSRRSVLGRNTFSIIGPRPFAVFFGSTLKLYPWPCVTALHQRSVPSTTNKLCVSMLVPCILIHILYGLRLRGIRSLRGHSRIRGHGAHGQNRKRHAGRKKLFDLSSHKQVLLKAFFLSENFPCVGSVPHDPHRTERDPCPARSPPGGTSLRNKCITNP